MFPNWSVKNFKIQLLTDLLDLELFLEDSGRQDEDYFGVEVITKDKITLFSNFRRRFKNSLLVHCASVMSTSNSTTFREKYGGKNKVVKGFRDLFVIVP